MPYSESGAYLEPVKAEQGSITYTELTNHTQRVSYRFVFRGVNDFPMVHELLAMVEAGQIDAKAGDIFTLDRVKYHYDAKRRCATTKELERCSIKRATLARAGSNGLVWKLLPLD